MPELLNRGSNLARVLVGLEKSTENWHHKGQEQKISNTEWFLWVEQQVRQQGCHGSIINP